MSDIAPLYIAENGDTIAFGVPFSKISIKDRTVEGFATLDNVDSQFDVVDIAASREAFANWIGNVREMHAPVAVGKAVSIEERTLERNGKTYKGIWVKVKISRGAESTWQKILDGVLQGFSIGGAVLERRPEVVKSDDGRYSTSRVNRITKYILGELSVVDNPANPLALFDAISKGLMLIKSDGGKLVAGDAILESQGLFYCKSCDIAKVDGVDFSQIDCLTCDKKMDKIGEVTQAPTVSELRKMVDEVNKAVEYDVVIESDGESGFGYSGEWKPDPEVKGVEVEQVNAPEGAPQSESPAPHAEKAVEVEDSALDAQTAEGNKHEGGIVDIRIANATVHSGEYIIPRNVAEKVFEALKSRVESPGRSRVDKSEEITKTIVNEGGKYCVRSKDGKRSFGCYSSESAAQRRLGQIESFGKSIAEDQEFVKSLLRKDFEFNPESVGEVRASIAMFNMPGKRVEKGLSLLEWVSLGQSIALGAGDEHVYIKGRIEGPLATQEDFEHAKFIVDLQKNTQDGNNDMIKLLQNLVGYIHDDASINKGGETPTLDVKELEKILSILEAATKEVGDVIKGFNVERLNSEDASGPSLGSDPGEAGVGTSQENDGGEARTFSEVEVAKETSLPSPDNGSDKIVPDAIPVDGTGVHEGITADSGSEKVLPHADLASTSVTTKAEGAEETKEVEPEDLMKGFLTKIEGAFDAFNERLTAIEESGGMKKSLEVGTELKKSDDKPFWGGTFSADELKNDD